MLVDANCRLLGFWGDDCRRQGIVEHVYTYLPCFFRFFRGWIICMNESSILKAEVIVAKLYLLIFSPFFLVDVLRGGGCSAREHLLYTCMHVYVCLAATKLL